MLQESDYGMTDMAMQGQQGRFSADDTLLVKFYMHPGLNQAKTKTEGRPIYEERPYVSIMQPGNKDSIIQRPATERDKQRFSRHWEKFQSREKDEGIEGTLLEEWPGLTRSQVEELKYLNIRTVEQLANVSDSNAQGVMGVNMLRQKAAAYLETSKDNATAEALEAANARIDELSKIIIDLQNDAPSKRKTKKKEDTDEVS